MRTINMVRNEIKYVAELDLRLDDLPPVVCHPQQIGQVVMNLLMNAAHSIQSDGLITLAASQFDDSVEISVTDNGCGISAEHLERIFEPFFTTKESGRGTGLGLAISHDIVKKHGGELLVESTTGKGTTFTIRLPIDPENVMTHLKES
jgi:two-component system NtrC family sensor kinase